MPAPRSYPTSPKRPALRLLTLHISLTGCTHRAGRPAPVLYPASRRMQCEHVPRYSYGNMDARANVLHNLLTCTGTVPERREYRRSDAPVSCDGVIPHTPPPLWKTSRVGGLLAGRQTIEPTESFRETWNKLTVKQKVARIITLALVIALVVIFSSFLFF